MMRSVGALRESNVVAMLAHPRRLREYATEHMGALGVLDRS